MVDALKNKNNQAVKYENAYNWIIPRNNSMKTLSYSLL